MKIFILAKIRTPKYSGEGFNENETILDTYYNVKGEKLNKTEQEKRLQSEISFEEVSKHLKEEDPRSELISFQFVSKPSPRWVYGEYYAHEYDQYLEGRARLLKWTKDFKELEVECLDKSKRVLDGIWEYYPNSSRQDNGCGDWFASSKPMK